MQAPDQQTSSIQQSPVVVTFDDWGIQLQFQGKTLKRVSWNEIDLVAICIEDDFLPFPYWYIGNKAKLLRIPNDAIGSEALFFDGLSQHLVGYRAEATYQAIIDACSALEGSFVVWQSPNVGGSG